MIFTFNKNDQAHIKLNNILNQQQKHIVEENNEIVEQRGSKWCQ